MRDNVSYVTSELLKDAGVKISSDFLYERLNSNPSYPSIRSISDFLKEILVDHRVLRLTREDLISTGGPFIAHSNERDGTMYYVTSIGNNEVVCSDYPQSTIHLSFEEFFNKWSGVSLFAVNENKTNTITLSNFREAKVYDNSLKWGLTFLVLLFLIRWTIKDGSLFIEGGLRIPSWYYFYGTKLAGFAFSLLMIMHEMKIPSSIIYRLCHVTKNADCDSVTKSKMATIYGGVTLADVGLTYFGGSFLAMMLTPTILLIPVLMILSVAILPVSLFLVLYQVISIKKWCPLCMAVQVIIILEAFISTFIIKGMHFSPEGLFTLPSFMILVFLLLFYFRSSFQFKGRYLKERIGAQKLKRDPAVIDAMLQRGSRVEIPESKYNLIFGERGSVVELTAFLSLHCSGCVRLYKELRSILTSMKGMSVQIIFSSSLEGKEALLSKKVEIAYLSGEMTKALQYLDDWFDHQEPEGSDFDSTEIEMQETKTSDFTSYNNRLFEVFDIKLVPSLFINGYEAPKGLIISELVYYPEYLNGKDSSSQELFKLRKEVSLR